MKSTGIGPILSETTCHFRIPLTFPDQVSIGARVSKIDDSRFIMEYAVVSHKHEKIAADGTGTLVAFDYRQNKKSSWPETIRQAISILENSAVAVGSQTQLNQGPP